MRPRRSTEQGPYTTFRRGVQVRCQWDAQPDTGFYTCSRISLPGRSVCHVHAGQKNRIARDRARRKAARKAKRASR